MNFIERLLSLSPDGGSGLTEFVYLALPILVAGIAYMRRAASSRS